MAIRTGRLVIRRHMGWNDVALLSTEDKENSFHMPENRRGRPFLQFKEERLLRYYLSWE